MEYSARYGGILIHGETIYDPILVKHRFARYPERLISEKPLLIYVVARQ